MKKSVTPRKTVGWNTWLDKVGFNSDATRELKAMFGYKPFETPKPTSLLEWIIALHEDDNALVLDSFAGSGTTAHAVLKLNAADSGNRRFVLVEMDEPICREVTAQRIRKAIEGYNDVPALGGGFRYCRLANALFDATGSISGEVRFTDLAAHVFFTETGSPIPNRADSKTPLLGVHQGRAVYLLFNGILGDRRPAAGNVLTHDVAQARPRHPAGNGACVVYGEACRLGPNLWPVTALRSGRFPLH